MERKTKVHWGRIILFAIMFLGLFLALCSLASLSYINGKNESIVPIVLRFDTTLKKVQSNSIFEKVKPNKLDTAIDKMWDQFKSFVNSKTARTIYLTKTSKIKYKVIADSLERQFIRHMNYLSKQKNDYVKLYNSCLKAQQDNLTQADAEFRQNAEDLPAGLLAKYSEKLIIYIMSLPYEATARNNYNTFCDNLQLYLKALIIGNDKLQFLYDELKTGEESIEPSVSEYVTIPALPDKEQYNVSEDALIDKKMPSPPKLGEDWGIFADAIGWLVGPKNTDLLVLIGMLGFALFGSAISVYITRNLSDASVSISQSITLVLVRGFSAAIIVFLAIRCGLIIVNTGENNPNPILLFLFCFIGSVFSEPIWEWAKGRIGSLFPKQVKTDGVDGTNGPNKRDDSLPKS